MNLPPLGQQFLIFNYLFINLNHFYHLSKNRFPGKIYLSILPKKYSFHTLTGIITSCLNISWILFLTDLTNLNLIDFLYNFRGNEINKMLLFFTGNKKLHVINVVQ